MRLQWEAKIGGKGQSGPVAENDQIVQMEQQQAADAKQAEADRQARLTQGSTAIRNLFEGTPVMKTTSTPYDWSKFTANSAAPGTDPTTQDYGLPSGYKVIQTDARATPGGTPAATPTVANTLAGTAAAAPDPYFPVQSASQGNSSPQGRGYRTTPNGGYNNGATMSEDPTAAYAPAAPAAASKVYALQDANGNTYYQGDKLNYDTQTPTGETTGGFKDDFYNKYRQSIMDYYMPQEGKQYGDARSKLNYSLARAGQLNSSTAGTGIADLANQDQINQAQIAAGADSQTAGLRSTIAQDEQTALNQLYSTEDPSIAANTAGNLVANAQLTKPLLNPAGALFDPMVVGVGNALTGFLNPTAYIGSGASGASGVASTSSGAINTAVGSTRRS